MRVGLEIGLNNRDSFWEECNLEGFGDDYEQTKKGFQ